MTATPIRIDRGKQMTENYDLYSCPNGCPHFYSSDWLALRLGIMPRGYCPVCKIYYMKNEADKGEVMTESQDPVELLDLGIGQHQVFKGLEEGLMELDSKLDEVLVELQEIKRQLKRNSNNNAIPVWHPGNED
jgi:hypothetical protein